MLNRVSNKIIINIKSILNNKSNIVLFFVITSSVLIIPIIFIPLRMCFGMINTLITVIFTMILFSYIHNNYRNSTLKNNENTNKNHIIETYISSLVAVYLLVIMIIIYFLLALSVYNKLIGFEYSIFKNNDKTYIFKELNLTFIFYNSSTLIMAMFCFCVAFTNVFKTEREFFILTSMMIIFIVLFGSVFNDFFGSSSHINEESNSKVWLYFDGSNSIYPEPFFYFSLCLPFYSNSQLLQASIGTTLANEDGVMLWYSNIDLWTWHDNSLEIFKGITGQWKWNVLYIMPWIHSIFYFLLAILLKYIRN